MRGKQLDQATRPHVRFQQEGRLQHDAHAMQCGNAQRLAVVDLQATRDGHAADVVLVARQAPVRPGSVVLLLGTGGVSLFALQFAKASGATVILASSSDEKLERARRLGADHLINYRATPAWDGEVLKLTGGRGADLVVETVGGATIVRSLNAAAVGGTVFTVGFVGGTAASIDLLPVIVKALRIVGNNTGCVADLAQAAQAIAAHGIVPVIDRVFSIDDTAEAYAELAAGGRHFGKLAIAH